MYQVFFIVNVLHYVASATQSHPLGSMLVSLTVGKVDAGVAVLLTEDKRLVRSPRCSQAAMCACTSCVCTAY